MANYAKYVGIASIKMLFDFNDQSSIMGPKQKKYRINYRLFVRWKVLFVLW